MSINSLYVIVSWKPWSTVIPGKQKYRYNVLVPFNYFSYTVFTVMLKGIGITAIIFLYRYFNICFGFHLCLGGHC